MAIWALLSESQLQLTDPATRDAVMKLKPGQYSPIIPFLNPGNRQAIGFRIVKLIAKEPAGQRELADPRVQQAIRSATSRSPGATAEGCLL